MKETSNLATVDFPEPELPNTVIFDQMVFLN